MVNNDTQGVCDVTTNGAKTDTRASTETGQSNLSAPEACSPPSAQIGKVSHGLGRYPDCTLYKVDYAVSVAGAGEGGAGGGNLITVPAEFELDGCDTVTVRTVSEFSDHTEGHKLSDTMYGFAQAGSDASLLLILR